MAVPRLAATQGALAEPWRSRWVWRWLGRLAHGSIGGGAMSVGDDGSDDGLGESGDGEGAGSSLDGGVAGRNGRGEENCALRLRVPQQF